MINCSVCYGICKRKKPCQYFIRKESMKPDAKVVCDKCINDPDYHDRKPDALKDWEKELMKKIQDPKTSDDELYQLTWEEFKSFFRHAIAAERERITGFLKYEVSEFNKGCGVCGGKLVKIRGRYPKEPRRKVCPTCLMEIRESTLDNLLPQTGNSDAIQSLTKGGEK